MLRSVRVSRGLVAFAEVCRCLQRPTEACWGLLESAGVSRSLFRFYDVS